MTTFQHLKTGGDPRLLPDYRALREELAKLSHPARPDVDWVRVAQLSLTLIDRNGADLQTAAWYTLARTRLDGLAGLNDGLGMINALIADQWGRVWPLPAHARTEILSSLSQRLLSRLRALAFGYGDLPQVYAAEQHLKAILDALTRLELKNASRVEAVYLFMRGASARLEKMAGESGAPAPAGLVSAPAERAEPLPARDEPPRSHADSAAQGSAPPLPDEADLSISPTPRGSGAVRGPLVGAFAAGMLLAAALGGAALWAWQQTHPAPAPLPVAASETALEVLEQQPPLWLQNYGFTLADGAGAEASARLKAHWQQHIAGNALPQEALTGWSQGMAGLQDLIRRLNALDERKGKYLTGSELKSMAFAITQSFERSIPVEERLYRLSLTPEGEPLPAAQLSQTDLYLTQLLNRYALIKQRVATP